MTIMKKIFFASVLLVLNVLAVIAQGKTLKDTITVSGTITDARTGIPLAGAQLWTLDKQISAMTDEKGEYQMYLPSLNGVLSIMMPGYTLREVSVQGRSQLSLSLYPTFFTSGYGQIENLLGVEPKITSAQTANSVADFSQSTALSPENEIQARLGSDARVITRSGVPGMGGTMFIRGLNSLNANAQPLILVDGVVWDNQWDNTSVHQGFFSNPLSNINMQDIESITVLKDGNTLYGSKAANGVIMINTKRGKDMVTRITANLYWGSNAKPRTPKMMNATQYREYASNQINGWINKYYPNARPNEQDIIKTFPFLNDDVHQVDYWQYHNDTDWSDVIYSNALTQNYSLNVNGGDEIALYNLSMGYTSAEGNLSGTGMDRFSVRFNSDVKLAENLFSKIDVSVARTTRELRDQEIDYVSSPEYIALIKAPFLSPYRMNSAGKATPTLESYDEVDPQIGNLVSNPLALVENASGDNKQLTFRMRINPYWQVHKNLRISTVYSYGLNSVKESFFIPGKGIAPRLRPDGMLANNEVRDLTQYQTSIFSDTKVDWKLKLTDSHHLAFLGGFRYMTDNYQSSLPRGYNTGNDNVKVLTDGIGYKEVSGDDDQWKSLSWYGNVGYEYLNKYFLAVTASADASSRFGSESGFRALNANWALFPSVSGAWLISAENFMKNATAINFLKLRASYGLTGNDDINSIASRSYLSTIRYIGKAIGLQLANIQNKTIQWETTAKANVGIDVHFLNERLGISLDVYNNCTDNLLTLKELESFTGQDTYWSNDGQLTNKGYELAFNAKILNLRQLKWELGASVAHYKNQITALPDNKATHIEILNGRVLTEVGRPAGAFYGYKTQGVFMTDAEAQAEHNGQGLYRLNANGTKSYYAAGDVRFHDANNDGKIDEADWQVIGDPNPDLYGVVTNRFQWKRLTLDVLCTYSYGNDIYNALRSQLEAGNSFHNQTVAMVNRWQSDRQAKTNIPQAIYGDPQGNSLFSDRWIEDGSYLRLKTLTLAYDIPFDSPFLQGITVWASANNLWTLTKYLGSDPEFSMNNQVLYQGIDAGLSPQGKSYYIGVKINL
ncbi:MAG: TonB-dependent receptor SusC [Candidatus Ordinivivax streblomastigis]|uniref:TonB-dependent receptor SusC n=1 Tax=Candidatus Ordinivivax streblomastigis TaxID=2540710 RepID=A0A5M8P4P9_9BACT|nr:MAG: TonB-dependent receptor SusC [Candidatus Ordinivivax streblomastigis]KAA6303344.1 MAG: TonB-dependent receptor SusC [Candidatus Ordinivivax streblomastigis]